MLGRIIPARILVGDSRHGPCTGLLEQGRTGIEFFKRGHGPCPPHLRQIGGAGLGGDGFVSHGCKITRCEAVGKLADELENRGDR
jgi:hypothetical protein